MCKNFPGPVASVLISLQPATASVVPVVQVIQRALPEAYTANLDPHVVVLRLVTRQRLHVKDVLRGARDLDVHGDGTVSLRQYTMRVPGPVGAKFDCVALLLPVAGCAAGHSDDYVV